MFENTGNFSLVPITFTKATTVIPGIRAEYLIGKGRVQFHLFPKDDTFDENTESALKKAFSSFPEKARIIDYVPEVNSWYVEIRGFGLTPNLVENLVSRVAKAVESNG